MEGSNARRFGLRFVLMLVIVVVTLWVAARAWPPGPHVFRPDEAPVVDVPLDPASPWPKFRANSVQNGRSPVDPVADPALRPWTFRTGKGVFSSPVIDADGTVYIGSADRFFYAIDRDGRPRWKFETGEVVDSSALLDDEGRVIFGSGDARLYALDRATGDLLWQFQADPVAVVEERYGVDSYNVDWFEGNVALLADGTVLAPNDNFLVYAVDRETGEKKLEYLGNELMWSLPAVNTRTGRIFAGSQYMAWKNVYAFDAGGGEPVWTSGGWGSNAASPLLTSRSPEGALVIGGYDGFVRAYSQATGRQLWKRGTRDHVYASPAQLSDGTIVQPSTDGTVYALEPATGEVKWAFDTLGPIRASPAVDARDRIYVGNGEGRLYCIEPDGTLRWSYLLIDGERNDLNGSPGLGPHGVVVAGQDGGVFFVPWDHPLTEAGRRDPRSVLGPGEALPDDGVFLLYTEPFGRYRVDPPETIEANQPLAFTLFVREGGDTRKALFDPSNLEVRVSGDPAMRLDVSADGQFWTAVPETTWIGPEGGSVRVEVRGGHLVDPRRFGLKFFGGRPAGRIDRDFTFRVPPRAGTGSPYRVPDGPGELATRFEFSRFAAPNPTMLPSWNQIGFDSLHYLAGPVEGTAERALVWVVAGRVREGRTLADPELDLRFPLEMTADGGLLTFVNRDGFEIDFVGSWEMPFGFYRVSTRFDPDSGRIEAPGALNAVALANELEYYGNFLKLLGMAHFRTGHMAAFGGLDLRVDGEVEPIAPEAAGQVSFERDADGVSAIVRGGSLRAADHVYSLVVVDAASGRALPLDYTKRTEVGTDPEDRVVSVRIGFDGAEVPDEVRALYVVDTVLVARGRP